MEGLSNKQQTYQWQKVVVAIAMHKKTNDMIHSKTYKQQQIGSLIMSALLDNDVSVAAFS